jgi:hypothetical protein
MLMGKKPPALFISSLIYNKPPCRKKTNIRLQSLEPGPLLSVSK